MIYAVCPVNHSLPEILSYLLEYLYSVGFLSMFIRHPGLHFFKLDTYSANETFSQHIPSAFSCIFSVYSHFPQNIISSFLASSKPTCFGGLSHASQYSLFISNIRPADFFFFIFKQITKDQSSWKKSFSHIETGYTWKTLNKYIWSLALMWFLFIARLQILNKVYLHLYYWQKWMFYLPDKNGHLGEMQSWDVLTSQSVTSLHWQIWAT